MPRCSWTISRLTSTSTGYTDPILLVVSQDLFNRGHSTLFGLARESAGVAAVSTARLANEYYGLEASDDALIDRIVTEGAHEVGHLLGLPHCTNRECIMFCPDTLDELNGKKKRFCDACHKQLNRNSYQRSTRSDGSFILFCRKNHAIRGRISISMVLILS